MSTEEFINSLKAFRSEAKFGYKEPEFSMLNPSPEPVTVQAKNTLHNCIDAVIEDLKSGADDKKRKSIIAGFLSKVEKQGLDTEDREYVAYYFHKLGKLSGVNVSFNVNKWLYGSLIAILATLFKKG